MTASVGSPARDLLEAARSMQEELRTRAEEIETARRLPRDISKRFAEAGFYRTCIPQCYGGLELPPADTARMIETLACADGSSAWCAFIGATSGSALAMLPEANAREIFSEPDRLIAGVFAPRGRARRVSGGFRVSGQWAWGSGTQNADFVLAGCQVFQDEEVERLASGAPRVHMMLVPASEVVFLDTWHVSGLCGTGSTDFTLDDVFVPEGRAVGFLQSRPPSRPLYAFPQFGLLALGVAAVSLGLARAGIEALVELAGGKRPEASRRTLAQRPGTQSEVARAEAGLRSARAFFYEAIEAAWSEALATGVIAVERRRDLRLATTHGVRAAADAVDRVYHLGGGSSVYRRSPLQRIFRDVHVASQHMMVGPPTLELTGRLLLGVEADVSQL